MYVKFFIYKLSLVFLIFHRVKLRTIKKNQEKLKKIKEIARIDPAQPKSNRPSRADPANKNRYKNCTGSGRAHLCC